jgi:hypothetical protein
MTTDPTPPTAKQLLQELQYNEALRHQPVAGTELDPHLVLLRTWQSERLATTYADLLVDKQYRPACEFFLSDIYAPRDFSQRDHDTQRIHEFLLRVFPAHMMQLLTDVVELNTLSAELDQQLVRMLVDQLKVTDRITVELYAEGYRLCDNFTAREHQIDLVTRVVTQVGEGARKRIIGVAMKLVRVPVYQAGWVELYDFLRHGYDAFRQMRDVTSFVQIVEQRERRILSQIFSNHPAPLAL